MNRLKATLVAATVLFASHAWAQPAAQADQGAAPSKHNDEIVQMRMEIAAANKKYNQKVAAARKVYNGGLKSEVQHLSRIRCCNARQNYFIPAPST